MCVCVCIGPRTGDETNYLRDSFGCRSVFLEDIWGSKLTSWSWETGGGVGDCRKTIV